MRLEGVEKQDVKLCSLLFTQNIKNISTSNQFPFLNSCHLMCVMRVFYYSNILKYKARAVDVNQSNAAHPAVTVWVEIF